MFLTVRVVRCWNRLPIEVVNSPSLQIFSTKLAKALSNLLWLWGWPCFEQSWTRWPTEATSDWACAVPLWKAPHYSARAGVEKRICRTWSRAGSLSYCKVGCAEREKQRNSGWERAKMEGIICHSRWNLLRMGMGSCEKRERGRERGIDNNRLG